MAASTDFNLAPLTLLDALNTLLRSVGLSEASSLLDSDSNKDSQNAFSALNRANADVQAEGWNCNTEEEFAMVPTILTGHVEVPDSFLRVRPDRRHGTWSTKRVTVRGGKLYNLTDHTLVWTETVYLAVTQALDFEDLPQALRWLITCRAGRQFAMGTHPSTGALRFTAEEEASARARAEHEDSMLRDETLPETSPHFARMRRR